MPGYVVSRLADELNSKGKCLNGAQILLLGMAYKPDVDDLRESPALRLIELLREQGADVSYNDPHISRLHRTRRYDRHVLRGADRGDTGLDGLHRRGHQSPGL